MNRPLLKLSYLLLASFLVLNGWSAQAAIISPPIDFDVATDYTNNFVLTEGVAVTHDNINQRMQLLGTNVVSISRYDTIPGNGTMDNTDFLTETLALTVRYNTFNNSSVGLISRVRLDNSLGILALLNATSATEVRLRLFHGAQTIGGSGAGTSFFDQTFTGLSNTIATNSNLFLTLQQSSGADPIFNFTISDADGLVASTGNQIFTTNDSYNSPGAVALRFFVADAGSNTITFDNFAAVPEPSSLILAGAGMLAVGFLALRRKSRR